MEELQNRCSLHTITHRSWSWRKTQCCARLRRVIGSQSPTLHAPKPWIWGHPQCPPQQHTFIFGINFHQHHLTILLILLAPHTINFCALEEGHRPKYCVFLCCCQNSSFWSSQQKARLHHCKHWVLFRLSWWSPHCKKDMVVLTQTWLSQLLDLYTILRYS